MSSTVVQLLARNTSRPGAAPKKITPASSAAALARIVLGGASTATGESKLSISSSDTESDGTQNIVDVGNGTDTLFAVKHSGALSLGVAGAMTTVEGDLTVDEDLSVTGSAGFGNMTATGSLRLNEITDPTNVANKGFVYTKDVSGTTELFYMDSAGNATQLTTLGDVNAGGTTPTFSDVYTNSSSPADITFTNGKGIRVFLHNSVGANFSILDSASNSLFAVSENLGTMLIGHANAVPTFATTPVPQSTGTQGLGTSSKTWASVYARALASDASQDLTLSAGQDVIASLTNSRSTAMVVKQGSNSFLTFNTTDNRVEFGKELRVSSGVNITFASGASTLNGTQVQNLVAGVASFTAGTGGVTAGSVVYMDTSSGKVRLADANEETHIDQIIGIALETASADSSVRVHVAHGSVITGLSGLTAGSIYYVSETAGDLTTTAPTTANAFIYKVGLALSTSVLFYQPMHMGQA